LKPSNSNYPFSDKKYQDTVIIPLVKDISDKFRLTGNVSILGPFSKEMSSRQSSVCTTSHVIVADVTKAKQADVWKYA
jgi:hypothetical protein